MTWSLEKPDHGPREISEIQQKNSPKKSRMGRRNGQNITKPDVYQFSRQLRRYDRQNSYVLLVVRLINPSKMNI